MSPDPVIAADAGLRQTAREQTSAAAMPAGLEAGDFCALRSVGEVRWSPDGACIAYTVVEGPSARTSCGELRVLTVATGATVCVREGGHPSAPEWSPDGAWIAYTATADDRSGLFIVRPDGSGNALLTPLASTNAPLPNTGKRYAWAPDASRLAFVSATRGPASEETGDDPVVITRYLYKPHGLERHSRFNDNRRLHIFIVGVRSHAVEQLTGGDHHEHSIDWSPDGDEILFISNREPNEDQFFNYDLFAVRVADGVIRRLTATENAEYRPHWSPDGRRIAYQATRRGLTNLETTMEHAHLWLMEADGSHRRELGSRIDNRQGEPAWSSDGQSVYCAVHQRGSVHLYRLAVSGADPQAVIDDVGAVTAWSVNRDGAIAYAFTSRTDQAQLYLKRPDAAAVQLTDLNAAVLRDRALAPVSSFTFISNDNKYEVEAFLTPPLHLTADRVHPLIVVIHGGPHNQQGPAFNFDNQVYAARGFATLMVNYRGSVGYGQRFTDAIFGDQNGNEAQDVLYGLSAALRRYLWIDRDRLGVEGISYGGQLAAWLITQTHVFKAAIPIAAVVNLVSFNYTAYYNQYEQMEWGVLPHQSRLMDVLWERSALKYVAAVRTPTMLIHGENDSDVPIGESEQFYVALKDVGVETVMVRYPREAHVLKEPAHVVDRLERSMRWYEEHFSRVRARAPRGR